MTDGERKGGPPLTQPVLTGYTDGEQYPVPKLPAQLNPDTEASDNKKLALKYTGSMNSSISCH